MAIRYTQSAGGGWSAVRTASVNASSGEVFDWRRVWQQLREAADDIKEECREILLTAAERTAQEAGAGLPVYRRKTTQYPKAPSGTGFGPAGRLRSAGYRVREISRFRVRASSVERYANFVDSQPHGVRQAAGKNRGTITPTPVIGRVAGKWRAWMYRELQAVADRHATREIR